MARSTKATWLDGPGDLQEAEVEDVPVKGQNVRVRGLPAAYSNQASSEALELVTGRRGQQTTTINTARMEVLQFAHGVIDPQFTESEAELISQKYGPAFRKVIQKIDELSGVDKAAIEDANARFQDSGGSEAGTPSESVSAGDGGPTVPSRASA